MLLNLSKLTHSRRYKKYNVIEYILAQIIIQWWYFRLNSDVVLIPNLAVDTENRVHWNWINVFCFYTFFWQNSITDMYMFGYDVVPFRIRRNSIFVNQFWKVLHSITLFLSLKIELFLDLCYPVLVYAKMIGMLHQ